MYYRCTEHEMQLDTVMIEMPPARCGTVRCIVSHIRQGWRGEEEGQGGTERENRESRNRQTEIVWVTGFSVVHYACSVRFLRNRKLISLCATSPLPSHYGIRCISRNTNEQRISKSPINVPCDRERDWPGTTVVVNRVN